MITSPLFQSFFIGSLAPAAQTTLTAPDFRPPVGPDLVTTYRRLKQHGLTTVRSTIEWRAIEPCPGHYDFSDLQKQLHAARELKMEMIWQLTYDEHPAGLSVTDPEFLPQFIKMVSAVSGLLRGESNTMPYIILGSALPFLAGVSGEKGITPPTAQVDSATLQHRLVRTVIEAIDTIWAVCPSARIIHADPVFHFGRSSHHNQPHPLAALYDRERCRIWDMIAGRTAPELGGQPHYLGLLEVACPSSHQAADNAASPHRLLGRTLDKLYQRYRRPLLVTVPDYGQVTRFGQLQALYHELQAARHAGLPIDGLCLPPTFSRPQPINAPSQPRFPAATSANFHQLPLAAEARAFA